MRTEDFRVDKFQAMQVNYGLTVMLLYAVPVFMLVFLIVKEKE